MRTHKRTGKCVETTVPCSVDLYGPASRKSDAESPSPNELVARPGYSNRGVLGRLPCEPFMTGSTQKMGGNPGFNTHVFGCDNRDNWCLHPYCPMNDRELQDIFQVLETNSTLNLCPLGYVRAMMDFLLSVYILSIALVTDSPLGFPTGLP